MRGKSSTAIVCVGILLAACAWQLVAAPSAVAADSAKPADDARALQAALDKAIEYFRTQGQNADGAYSPEAGPAVTAIVTTAVLKSGRSVDDPLVAKSLKYLEGFLRPDGGVYAEKSTHQNYETCLAIECFAEAAGSKPADKHFGELVAKGEKYIREIQWGAKDNDKSNVNYGGAGYGNSKRPDLSNTSFFLDALKSVGRGPEDEAVKRALVFVSRCQNLETEYNTTPFAAKNPDGGFYYTPASGGNSQAGQTESGGLRSYASMTYAGLKSMIFAGVGPDDPRVKAAYRWIQEHYDLSQNPGMGSAGQYYYYQTFAKALAAMKRDELEDSSGRKHFWRHDLISELAGRQKPNGSWVNENSRWLEGNPNLVTAYAVLALVNCREGK